VRTAEEPIDEPPDLPREQYRRSTSARIIRGFSRIGIGIAVVVAIIGVIATAVVALQNHNSANYEFDKYACLLTANANVAVSGDRYKSLTENAGHCGYFSSYGTYNSLGWIKIGDAIEQNGHLVQRVTDAELVKLDVLTALAGLGITGAISLVIFGFFRGLGWILAGFASD
jgi:hypothetical protein